MHAKEDLIFGLCDAFAVYWRDLMTLRAPKIPPSQLPTTLCEAKVCPSSPACLLLAACCCELWVRSARPACSTNCWCSLLFAASRKGALLCLLGYRSIHSLHRMKQRNLTALIAHIWCLLAADSANSSRAVVCDSLQFGTANDDALKAVATTTASFIGCGSTEGNWGGANADSAGGVDFLVSSMSISSGSQDWAYQVGSSGADSCNAIAVTSSGGVVAAGKSSGDLFAPSGTNVPNTGSSIVLDDAVVLMLGKNGDEVWSLQIHTAVLDAATGVAALPSGDIVAVGHSTGSIPDCSPQPCSWIGGSQLGDWWVSRHAAADGEVVWRMETGTALEDAATAVAVDDDGNIFVAGHTNGDMTAAAPATSSGGHSGNYDPFVCKLDGETGDLLWCFQHGSSELDYARSVTLDASGNPIVCGETAGALADGEANAGGSSGTKDWYCMKVSAQLNQAPANTSAIVQDGTTADDVALGAVSLTALGALAVVGKTRGSLYGTNLNPIWDDTFFALLDIDTLGLVESEQYGSSSPDVATGVTTSGNAIVWVGQTHGSLFEGRSNSEAAEDALAQVLVLDGTCSELEDSSAVRGSYNAISMVITLWAALATALL
jgi:hypothetical protein